MPSVNDVMQIVDLLKSESVTVVANHCVALRNRNATCRRCVDACPVDAVSISARTLYIDIDTCMACGVCIPVCPTAAFVGLEPTDVDLAKDLSAALRQAGGSAVITCARMASHREGDPDKYTTVPCLGRVDEEIIVALAAHGVNDIVLVDGTCSTCKYGAVSSYVDDVLQSARDLLAMRGSGCAVTRASEFPPQARATDATKTVGAARRGLMSDVGGYAKDVALNAVKRIAENGLSGSGRTKEQTSHKQFAADLGGKLPAFQADRNMRILDDLYNMGELVESEMCMRLFGTMIIDADSCSGCGMCVVFCPTEAVKYAVVDEHPDEAMRYLEFQVADCTQCGLCVDVCLRHCLEISPIVATEELFDFEPRLIEIPQAKNKARFFG